MCKLLASQEAFAEQYGSNGTFLTFKHNPSDYFQVPDSLRMFVDQGDIDAAKLSDLVVAVSCLIMGLSVRPDSMQST